MFINRLFWTGYQAYHMRGQAEYPFKPYQDVKRDGDLRVLDTVAYAYRYVPYYRETMDRLGFRPSDFRKIEDLSKLPILERHQIQRNPDYFISKARPINRYLSLRSGGSTGVPITVYYDQQALFRNAAYSERARAITTAFLNNKRGYREIVITSEGSNATVVERFCRDRGLFPNKLTIERKHISLLDPPEKNIRKINDFKPDVVRSYGSYLEILFAHVESKGAAFFSPRLIIFSSDGLSDSIRKLIERKYKISVFSNYHTVEAFSIGFECDHHRGIHINMDIKPIRIVDREGRAVRDGQSGEVIVSDLVNRAMILLNYRIGDIAAILPEACPCGRSLPLLSFLQGRSDDWIQLASGELVHPQSVRPILIQEENVWQFQVIQKTASHFSVKLVTAETCDRQHTRERIAAKFARTFGEGVTIDVSFVDAVDRTLGGKTRLVISKYKR
ncbi:MAG: phenylacetate--CoA ligase family protein [Desulfobacteraceae bacterium]|nr:phenylacetate--CoA ligase family protein [Desulfobacteraceae bacterium]